MSAKIVNLLYETNYIKEEEKEAYIYCFSFLTEYILFILSTLIIAVLFNILIPMTLFLSAFLMLRAFGGGFHASTHKKCVVYSYMVIVIFCTIISTISHMQSIPYTYWIDITYVISCISYLIFSPAIPSNKRISHKEYLIYKLKSTIICSAISLLYLLFALCNQILPCISLCFAAVIASSSIIINKLSEKEVPNHES